MWLTGSLSSAFLFFIPSSAYSHIFITGASFTTVKIIYINLLAALQQWIICMRLNTTHWLHLESCSDSSVPVRSQLNQRLAVHVLSTYCLRFQPFSSGGLVCYRTNKKALKSFYFQFVSSLSHLIRGQCNHYVFFSQCRAVCRFAHHFDPDGNISTTIGWLAINFGVDIYGLQKMKPYCFWLSSYLSNSATISLTFAVQLPYIAMTLETFMFCTG